MNRRHIIEAKLTLSNRIATLSALAEDTESESRDMQWWEDVDRIGQAYEHYASTGRWVGGPVVTDSEKSDIREQVKRHGRELDGFDAARNVLGGWPPSVQVK